MANLDLNVFSNLDDTDLEPKIIELVRELDVLVANNPTINFQYLINKLGNLIHAFDNTYENIKIISSSNDSLLEEVNELKSHLDVSKQNMTSELNRSLKLQDNVIEENESLVQQLSELKEKLSKLQDKFYSSISENISLKALLSDVDTNAVDLGSFERVNSENSELKSKISFKDATIAMLKGKVDVLKNQNIDLSSRIESSLFEIEKIKAGNWNSGRWVEDSILQSYYDGFSAKEKAKSCKALFIGPSLSELLKNGLPCDIKEQILNINLSSYNYAFCCVSDNTQTEVQDGASHWSLLFIDMTRHLAFHLDSVAGLNSKFAIKLAGNLGFEAGICFEVPCIQQNNGFECGLNLLVNTVVILNGYCHLEPDSRKPFIEWFNQYSDNFQSAGPAPPLGAKLYCSSSGDATAGLPASVVVPRSSCINQLDDWKVVKNRYKHGMKCKKRPSAIVTGNRYNVLSSVPDIASSPQSNPDNFPKLQRKNSGKIMKLKDSKCNKPNSSGVWKISEPSEPRKNFFGNHSHPSISPNQVPLANPKPSEISTVIYKKPKISIFSDSHGRALSSLLSDNLKGGFEVFGSVKPNAKLGQVLDGLVNNVNMYTSSDIVIIIGGTNDIVNGHCGSIVSELGAVMGSLLAARVLVVQLPRRYDNHTLDQVALEVNKSLRIETSRWENATFVSTDTITRGLYTRHGLHLNMRGKRRLAKILSDIVSSPQPPINSNINPDRAVHTITPTICCPEDTYGGVNSSKPVIRGPDHHGESVKPSKFVYNSRFLEMGHFLLGVPWRLHLGKQSSLRII